MAPVIIGAIAVSIIVIFIGSECRLKINTYKTKITNGTRISLKKVRVVKISNADFFYQNSAAIRPTIRQAVLPNFRFLAIQIECPNPNHSHIHSLSKLIQTL